MSKGKPTPKQKKIDNHIRFCWHCGRKLWGVHKVMKEIDGHIRTLHKGCVNEPQNMIEELEAKLKEASSD